MSAPLLALALSAGPALAEDPSVREITQEALAQEITDARGEFNRQEALGSHLESDKPELKPVIDRLNTLSGLLIKLNLNSTRGRINPEFTRNGIKGEVEKKYDGISIRKGSDVFTFFTLGVEPTVELHQGSDYHKVDIRITDAEALDALDFAIAALTERLAKPDPLIQKLNRLTQVQEQLDFNKSLGYFKFSFDADGVSGQYIRGYGYQEIVLGEDSYYFEISRYDDEVNSIRLNGTVVPQNDQKVLAALDTATTALTKAITGLTFTQVEVPEKGHTATLRSVDGKISGEMAPGAWVASTGKVDAEGRVFAYTDTNADGYPELGWVVAADLKPAQTAAPQPAAAPEAFKPYTMHVTEEVRSVGGLRLRDKPITSAEVKDSKVLVQIPAGATVTVTAELGGSWVAVEYVDATKHKWTGVAAVGMPGSDYLVRDVKEEKKK